MTTKKLHLFPTFNLILSENFQIKKDRAVISEFIRMDMSIPEYAEFRRLDKNYLRRLLKKYGINADNIYYGYETIVKIVTEYNEVKKYHKRIVLEKYEISIKTVLKWSKKFLIHKDKKNNIKLFLIDKEWDKYKEYIKKKDKAEKLDVKNILDLDIE
jgi:transposase-like protein